MSEYQGRDWAVPPIHTREHLKRPSGPSKTWIDEYESAQVERNRAEQRGPVMAAEQPLPLTAYLEQSVGRLHSLVQTAREFRKRLAPISRISNEKQAEAVPPPSVHCEIRAGLDELNRLLDVLERGLREANNDLELP